MLLSFLSLLFFPLSLLAQAEEFASVPTHLGAVMYCAIMALSAAGFFLLRRIFGSAVPLIFYVIHSCIVLWSGLMYVHFVKDTVFAPYAYYMDWIISTPLIVLALCLTAMILSKEISWSLIFLALFCQMAIVVTGYFAQVLGPNDSGLLFYALGNVFMLGLFYIFWIPLLSIARLSGRALYRKFWGLALFVTVLWVTYPLVWVLGTPGLKMISNEMTSALFIILPIICKSGFGFIDIYLLNQLSKEMNKKLDFFWI
jgi:bacteriorhodopsin